MTKKQLKVTIFTLSAMFLYLNLDQEPHQEVNRLLQSQGNGNSQRNGQGQGQGQAKNEGNGKKKNTCTHTPYVLIGDILTSMPPIVPREERYEVPSHIQLCQAFLERYDGQNLLPGGGNGNGQQQQEQGNNGVAGRTNTEEGTGARRRLQQKNGKGGPNDILPVENEPSLEEFEKKNGKPPAGEVDFSVPQVDGSNEIVPLNEGMNNMQPGNPNQDVNFQYPAEDYGVNFLDPNEVKRNGPANNGNGQGNGNAGAGGQGGQGGGNGKGNRPITVVEDDAVCTDWQAPHISTLSIYASSLIAAVGKKLGLRYKHNCRKHIMKMHKDPNLHYDYTPVQALLPNNLIAKKAADDVEPETIKTLCMNCMYWFENIMEDVGPPAAQTHHCLLMPNVESSYAKELMSQDKQLPMNDVLASVVDRFRHIATDWKSKGGPVSKNEDLVGVVIAVDEGSSFMSFDQYDKIIPPAVRSIQVFASANCALAAVQGRSNCIEHGRRLKRYFLRTRTQQHGTYVRYDVVGSTATSYSRMINARILVCPPGTVMCLLPALAKKAGTKAYIGEDPKHPATYHWFESSVVQKRKQIGLQDVGFDAVPDEEFMDIITEPDETMDVEAIGETENEEHPPSDEDLDADVIIGEQPFNYTAWLQAAAAGFAADGENAETVERMLTHIRNSNDFWQP